MIGDTQDDNGTTYPPEDPPPNPPTQPPGPPKPPAPPPNRDAAIQAAYKKYLGRNASEADLLSWRGNDNFDKEISQSAEAQAFSRGDTYTRTYNGMPGWVTSALNDPNRDSNKYKFARAVQQRPDLFTPGRLGDFVTYYNALYGANARFLGGDQIDFGDGPQDIMFDSDPGGANRPLWGTPGASNSNSSSDHNNSDQSNASNSSRGFNANPVFSDPATTSWETLLDQFVNQLTQPQPTWTPSQLELQQTQVLDPMERQRQAMKQQKAVELSQRNIQPGTGIWQSAMGDIDRQFNQFRTTTQGTFATQAITREDQVRQLNEQRMLQAVNLLKEPVTLGDSRLLMANTILGGSSANPAQLLQLQQQFQQQQYQNQQYNSQNQNQMFAQLMQALLPLFA